MPQKLSGSALAGTGSLVTEVFGTLASLPAQNSLWISNSGEFNYITLEAVDPTSTIFNTGSNLHFANFSIATEGGRVAQGTAKTLSGTTDGSVFSWSLGKREFRFHVTSSSPLPPDTLKYTTKDFEGRIYDYYATWSATAGTLARNLTDKINEVNDDGLEEVNAAFTDVGFFNLETSKKTAFYNGVKIYRNGIEFDTFSSTQVGYNPYSPTGGEFVNGHRDTNVDDSFCPFIAEDNHLSIAVPNTSKYDGEYLIFQVRAITGTIATNTFRIKAAGPHNNIIVNIEGE